MKSQRPCSILAATLAALLCTSGMAAAGTHYAPAPTAYSLTENNALMQPETVKIYRDGDRVMSDLFVPRNASVPHDIHIRSVIDLQTHQQISWDPTDSSVSCMTSTLGGAAGDWSGNPFEWLSQMVPPDLAPYHPHQLGTETVAGLRTRVTEMTMPDGSRTKIWVDGKYGLLAKMASAAQGKPYAAADLEVTQFTVGKPPASRFDLPAGCKVK